ncbi:hypothetical protein PR002_g22650 [Phytophthora rubi]|uniref:Integrase catalytic domain-containing protein n=1 Tax=Phytophthora rubi TaxID=129364 RepID=A0A6A3IR19_9STRA|nr:hypothetical protein PR002_g22650 [Phytophthora rubi]
MVDGYYQLLMRESDIPLTAVSTPSGMLWEWLVMPQGLSNAPATFTRLVTQLFRPMREFVQTYFDDIFVHSRASEGKTAVEAHLGHLREDGVRADPEKVCAIAQWPVPVSQKDLRKWLGLANYLHKYSANYAEMARPLTNLLKKDAVWSWTYEAQQAFEAIKSSLQSAPILALPNEERPFSVVCDASDFAIGCALLQVDAEGRERLVSFQSRQLKAAEKNYPVHDKELLAMKYALVKFRVHLLGQKPFVIYTDHTSLRTATSSPHLSQRMARWLSFFAEYNFTVEYKPGKQNVLADALSRRPDYELAHLAYLESPLYELIREAYADDDDLAGLVEALSAPNKAVELTARQCSRLHRYSVVEGLLYYQVDEGDESRIVRSSGAGKTYTSVARNFWWSHMYKWVRKYVQTCETCQRVKPAPSASAPLMSLPVPADCWRSVSMDFIFELPADARGHTGILVFVCRLSKMVRLAAVRKSVTAPQAAQLFVDNVFRNHGLPEAFVSDRDPRFVSHFWQHLFRLLGTRLDMSTADHPQTDGQTERVNRVLEDIHWSVCAAEPTKWSTLLPQVEFALNNAVHSSTGFTPFYVNGLRHPRLRTSVKRNLLSFIETGEDVRQRVRDAMAAAQDIQKEQSDRQGRKNT